MALRGFPARAHAFDAILMDISMPVMDGPTAARLIRAEGLSQTCRIYAVTAHGSDEDSQRFKQAGMDGWLTKPVSLSDLSRLLQGVEPRPAAPLPTVAPLGLDAGRQAELRAALGPSELQRAMTRFALDIETLLARLNASAADGPFPHLLAAFHEGAGAAAMVGANGLRIAFLKGEAACRETSRDAVLAAVASCGSSWADLRQTLNLAKAETADALPPDLRGTSSA